jgi:hypothetical protein
MTRATTASLAIALLLGWTACTYRVPVVGQNRHGERILPITLYQRPLELWLFQPDPLPKGNVLVVYATSDGGWRSLDTEIFRQICQWGYPAVGFSSSNYLKNLGFVSDTTTPRRLVRDFESIIEFAEQQLELPQNNRIVLVGMSRGAGLSVVAAGQSELRHTLAGVLAIALTKEEEHVVPYRKTHGVPRGSQPGREKLAIIKTYDYLPRLAGVPLTVLQSTHDKYLSADAARELFGPDTDTRKLVAINATSHTFSGGRETLYQWVKSTLREFARHAAARISQNREKQAAALPS